MERTNFNKKVKDKNDWAYFAFRYIQLARLGFYEIFKEKYKSDLPNYEVQAFYIPSLFNLKHGLEILLKAIYIDFFDKTEFGGDDYTHDVNKIFCKFKSEIINNKMIKSFDDLKRDNPNIVKRYDSLQSLVDELGKMVKKYYEMDFLKEKISNNYFIIDGDNTVFKYPTNNLSIYLDYGNLEKNFTKKDASDFYTDSCNIESLLWVIKILFLTKN